MAELPQELVDAIGRETDPVTYVVEPGAILRFADAIGDPNPLYWDKSRHGGIIAPPGFFGWPERGMAEDIMVFRQRMSFLLQFCWPLPREPFFPHPPPGAKSIVNMGVEMEYWRSVRAGERLTATCKVADAYQRQGRRFGMMVFIRSEVTYRDERGGMVAKALSTMMSH